MKFPTRMSTRQRIRLVLSNLLHANLALKLARREHTADPGPVTTLKHDMAKTAAEELRELAQSLVARFGTARDRARLAALLDVKWLWLMSLSLPA